MKNLIVSETSEHAAILSPRTKNVAVFRKAADGTLVPIGTGRWEDGIVRGSGVNCGILVRLEPALREQTGTP
jgi:hypothetical protein